MRRHYIQKFAKRFLSDVKKNPEVIVWKTIIVVVHKNKYHVCVTVFGIMCQGHVQKCDCRINSHIMARRVGAA